jgi:hypothetical protein
MTTVIAKKRVVRTLMLAGTAMLFAAAAEAGPEVTFYLTVPLGGASHGHVFGLRLDHSVASPDIRVITPESPLNRRALLDLQLGADSALKLDLDRRLTWDINRLQWRDSSLPATFNLRLPTREAKSEHPVQHQSWKPLVKLLPVEP